MRLKGEFLNRVSFPLGGIGAGSIGLAGNGRLIDWEIFNHPNKRSENGCSFLCVRAEKEGEILDTRVLHGDLTGNFEGEYPDRTAWGMGIGFGPLLSDLAGLPHFRSCIFEGTFPSATITFRDPQFPATVLLEAWSIFIPGNGDASSLPAACFSISFQNIEADALDFSAVFSLRNPFFPGRRENRVIRRKHETLLWLKSGQSANSTEYGELALASSGDVSSIACWRRNGWIEPLMDFWNDFSTIPGELRDPGVPMDVSAGPVPDTGSLGVRVHVSKGKQKTIRFVLAWHVPNCQNDWDPEIELHMKESGIRRNFWKNYYTHLTDSAPQTALHVLRHFTKYQKETFLFRDALYASSIPPEILDGISANLSILKTASILRVEDGTFWGWEGIGASRGTCEGSCQHVWNYAQALPLLFPDMARSMLEAHARYGMDREGRLHFRLKLPLGIRAQTDWERAAADGAFGIVMNIFREWKICGDREWLIRMYPIVRKIIEYAWSDRNYDLWDPEQSGVLQGRQHHTLDLELFGPTAWLEGFYLGALKAASEMADFLEDGPFACQCRKLLRAGASWVRDHLFNGEYFIQETDWMDERFLRRFRRPDRSDSAWEKYWDPIHKSVKYQLGSGCAIDQHLGQWHCSLYGLGNILDPRQVKSALRSIFRYNYRGSMRNEVNFWRSYALNDESAVLMCTWPRGGKPPYPLHLYSSPMPGFEWALASHLIMTGFVREGETVAKAVRKRFDGYHRNPWNEFECGSNYVRSMASYSLLQAYSGFSYDMVRKEIGFRPVGKIRGCFRCFWSLGTAWGVLEQEGPIRRIRFLYGKITLAAVACGEAEAVRKNNSEAIDFFCRDGRICFRRPHRFKAGDVIAIKEKESHI